MHPRKTVVQLVLSRLQVPVEVRTIIVENYFPFLPNESRKLTTKQFQETAELQYHYAGAYNLMHFNCNFDYNFSWWIVYLYDHKEKYNIFSVNIMRSRYDVPLSEMQCSGACADKTRCTHTCFVEANDKNERIFMPTQELEDDFEGSLQRILSWYRNTVLSFTEDEEKEKVKDSVCFM